MPVSKLNLWKEVLGNGSRLTQKEALRGTIIASLAPSSLLAIGTTIYCIPAAAAYVKCVTVYLTGSVALGNAAGCV